MRNGLRILAVITARSGSKGIPHKNMAEIGGRSLIARAADLLAGCDWIDAAIISTDSETYAEEARRHGVEAPFLRPVELSTDTAGSLEVLQHALSEMEHSRGRFDAVLIIEPTCPLRIAEDLSGCVDLLAESGADSVVSVSPVDTKFHPDKVLRISDGALAFYSASGAGIKRRQALEPLYYRNGACYALRRECLMEQHRIFGNRTLPYPITRPLVNIDEPFDLELARWIEARTDACGETIP